MKRLIMAVLIAAALPTAAAAQNWVPAGSTDELDQYVDAGSIRRSGSLVRLWINRVYRNPDDGIARRVGRTVYDCENETTRLVSWTSYDRNGGVVGTRTIPANEQTDDPVLPGSLADAVLKAVCQ